MNTHAAHFPVLGLLIEAGPDYGYRLGTRYSKRCAQLESALPKLSTSNFYAVLESLEAKRWIEESHREPVGKSGKKLRVYYRPTAEGAQAWRHWLVESFREDPIRHELLRRFCAVSDRVFLQVLDAYSERCLREIAALPRFQQLAPKDIAQMSREERIQRHLQQHKRKVLGAELDWTSDVRADVLAAIEYADAHGDPRLDGATELDPEADGRSSVA